MKHGGRIPRNAGQDKRECIFYPAGVSPILPARFERILVHFICDFPLDKLAHRFKSGYFFVQTPQRQANSKKVRPGFAYIFPVKAPYLAEPL